MTNRDIPLLFGPYGSPVLRYVDQLPAYGVNAIWFHGFDAQAFDQCARHNLAACVEFKTFRADFDQRPDLIPIGIDGKPIRYGEWVQGVCLSKQDFLAETKEALLHGLKDFQPAGIWLDYLTYAGWFETSTPDLQESCFCPDCVAEFCNATNLDATDPEYILTHHAHMRQLKDYVLLSNQRERRISLKPTFNGACCWKIGLMSASNPGFSNDLTDNRRL